jgi:2-C-methyl-D-erythritol 4-phosphate cytidylyltransferase
MGTETPKQFLPLHGKAIILHTIDKFIQALPEARLVLVLPEAEIARWKVMVFDTSYQNIEIAVGGASRFESVKAGLALIEGGLVGVHDAVRPLVSKQTILSAFETAAEKGSAIPVTPLKDSIRKVEGKGSKALDRNQFFLVQTPQCFHAKALKSAYEQAFSPNFTDDASVYESSGQSVALVSGNESNIKITSPEDLEIAAVLMR